MAGYVAAARVAHADIRWGASTRPLLDRPTSPLVSAEVEDLDADPLDERFSEWWASLREQVAITTFFLFDPDSWR